MDFWLTLASHSTELLLAILGTGITLLFRWLKTSLEKRVDRHAAEAKQAVKQAATQAREIAGPIAEEIIGRLPTGDGDPGQVGLRELLNKNTEMTLNLDTRIGHIEHIIADDLLARVRALEEYTLGSLGNPKKK